MDRLKKETGKKNTAAKTTKKETSETKAPAKKTTRTRTKATKAKESAPTVAPATRKEVAEYIEQQEATPPVPNKGRERKEFKRTILGTRLLRGLRFSDDPRTGLRRNVACRLSRKSNRVALLSVFANGGRGRSMELIIKVGIPSVVEAVQMQDWEVVAREMSKPLTMAIDLGGEERSYVLEVTPPDPSERATPILLAPCTGGLVTTNFARIIWSWRHRQIPNLGLFLCEAQGEILTTARQRTKAPIEAQVRYEDGERLESWTFNGKAVHHRVYREVRNDKQVDEPEAPSHGSALQAKVPQTPAEIRAHLETMKIAEVKTWIEAQGWDADPGHLSRPKLIDWALAQIEKQTAAAR